MKLRMYAVFDKKVEAYLPPLCFRSEGEAKRSFMDALSAQESQFARHRADYSFAFVGMYDDNLGRLEPVNAPLHILDGATALSAEAVIEEKDVRP